MSTDDYQQQRAGDALRRGIAYVHRHQWQQAMNALTSCLQEEPGNLDGRYYMAISQASSGRAREARRLLEQTLQLPRLDDFHRVRFLKLLGKVSIQSSDYHLAADSLHEAFTLTGVGGAPILNDLAQVMCKAGDFGRGFDLFFKAMEQNAS
ncbi:MAG: tetratricopeptide repeat protein [Myxococcota bacterium]